ncbi:MAG: DMT family transporter [Pirellulales bacterium]|nr:DMT family transporter [Pirellulales bacterium]
MSVYLKLCFGIVILSWSSVLVRWMGDIHPLIITFYRLVFSVLIIAPFVRSSSFPISSYSKKQRFSLFFAGLFLSMHFVTWIKSVQWTTVSNSIFLESTHPIFGSILSIVILREIISKGFFPVLLVAFIGMYFITSGDFQVHGNALAGDFLAILSAFFVAAYLVIARAFKETMDCLPYLFTVYGIAAITTFVVILIKGLNFWDLPAQSWILLLLMAIGPNLIGHSILNWASRKIPVYIVNMTLLGEAVLATLYAALVLDEWPHRHFYIGAALIVASILSVFVFNRQAPFQKMDPKSESFSTS